ncbi:MAG: hypothetical protein H0X26_03135 [Alphaproteobacteria bacterium]|nr:hypothetical protein [Alphaproteobacteria bacterium]
MKNILFLFTALLVCLENGRAEDAPKGAKADKTTIINIPSDLPTPPSAEKIVPSHPFFSESTGNEVMEKVLELEERIDKLEKKVSQIENGKS